MIRTEIAEKVKRLIVDLSAVTDEERRLSEKYDALPISSGWWSNYLFDRNGRLIELTDNGEFKTSVVRADLIRGVIWASRRYRDFGEIELTRLAEDLDCDACSKTRVLVENCPICFGLRWVPGT